MRYLHPVTMKERFIASGTYVHYHDGNRTGSVEHWNIHQHPDGAQFIRVDDDWREKDGSSVLLEAWRSPASEGGRIERVDVSAFGPKKADVKRVQATYTVIDSFLEVGRSIDDSERQQFEMELPFGYVLSPENLVFAGYEASHLAIQRGEPAPVVSYVPTFANASMAFRPTMYHQSVKFIAEETVTIAEKSYPVRRFEQTDPRTKAALTLWLDKHDMLLRYESDDGKHRAELTEYSRSQGQGDV